MTDPMIEPIARIRIELEGTQPLVWRELDVPLSTTLATLHDLIQVVMRWRDSHLHEFEVGEKIYGVPDPEDAFDDRKVYQAKSIRLGTLIDRGVREFLYLYDFGDNWRHRIMVLEVRQGDPGNEYPRFVAATRRAPRKMWAAFPALRSSWKRCPIQNMMSTTGWSNGTANGSTLRTSMSAGFA